MVAFLTARLRSLAVSKDLPRIHRLADMDSAVIHKIDLHHIMAAHFEKFRNRPFKKIVTDVSEMERLVGVRRRILDHDGPSGRSELSEILS